MIVPYSCPFCKEEINGDLQPDQTEAECDACLKKSKIPFKKLEPGMTIGGNYLLEEELSADSKGASFKAWQKSMDRHVAVKILQKNQNAEENEENEKRFQREVKLRGQLAHANLMEAYGSGKDNGMNFLVTQYREGTVLEDYLTRKKILDPDKTLRLIIPIAEALSHIWDKAQVVHRNVKPATILVSNDGDPLLMNLGIAKSMDSEMNQGNLTMSGYIMGTPEYMSPEQVRGKQDLSFSSDMYSLGIVLYRCLTGQLPFESKNAVELMKMQIEEAHQPITALNPEVPEKMSAIIDRMLAKLPEDRFESWEACIEAFRDLSRKKSSDSDSSEADKIIVKKKNSEKMSQGNGKKKRRQGERGMTRGEAEALARRLHAKGAIWRKLFLFSLSVLIPAAIAWYFYDQNNQKVARENMIQTSYKKAYNFMQENPDSYDTAIERFETVLAFGADTPYYSKSKGHIRDLRIKQVLYQLKQQARGMGKTQAARLYETYTGPFAGETEKERLKRASYLREQSKK